MVFTPSDHGISWCWFSLAWCATVLHFLLTREALGVAVTEVRLLSDSNRAEYVLHGEGATLTCHYILDPSEKVTEVEWEKDGVLVYLWSLDAEPRAMDVLEGYVDTTQKSPSTLTIVKAQMEMHGTYTCRVRTNGKTAQNEAYLMVIVDACSDNSWKTHTDMITCTESINMHCVGMFPKPSPACGVYSESTGKYLSSVPFDSVILLWNRTFEVSFNRRFIIKEWTNHTDISFRCYMIVLGTPWRSGIKHKMFGDPGCPQPPPTIAHGYYNMSEEKSCWGHPVEGTAVEYHCNDGYRLMGSSMLICNSGVWTTFGEVVDGDYLVPLCSDVNSGWILTPGMTSIASLLFAAMLHLWT